MHDLLGGDILVCEQSTWDNRTSHTAAHIHDIEGICPVFWKGPGEIPLMA